MNPETKEPPDREFNSFELDEEVIERQDTAIGQRIEQVKKSRRNWFAITPYKPNYILPLTYNTKPNKELFRALESNEDIDRLEAKFQLSLQFDIWKDIFKTNIDLYFAYTQLAFWQMYNTEASSPFRETNYGPEAGFIFRPRFRILGINNRQIRLGFLHQSNGRGEPLSRSWNRIFATFVLDKGDFVTVLRPWYRVPESKETDDNPDIDDFLGYFDWQSVYKWRNQTFGLMLRNNLKSSDNRGAIQIDWSYPLTDRLKLQIHYFNGYGESLIDYNHSTNRIGFGLVLTDWL